MRVPPVLSFAACTLIWGTTWLAIKEGYEGIDPLWGAAFRFFLAGTILLMLMASRGASLRIRRVDVGVVAFVGIILFGFDYGLIYWGEQFLPSGLTAILFATMPLFVGVFSALLIRGERWTPRHGLGVALGLLGLALVFREHLGFDRAAFWPMVAIVLSAAAAAVSSVVMRKYARETDPFFLNGGAMIVGAVALLGASNALGESAALPQGTTAWTATLYLAIFGSVVSFLLYFGLLHAWGANRSSLLTLLTPIVAVISGALRLHEALSPFQVVGAALVLGGVGLSLYRPATPRAPLAAASGGK